jgi:hypothetical protein
MWRDFFVAKTSVPEEKMKKEIVLVPCLSIMTGGNVYGYN